MKIGFIGLGLMGGPMAANILKAGFPLYVYNRTASKTKELYKAGAIVAGSPEELASCADVVIIMVTGPHDVAEVIFGKQGIVKGVKGGEKRLVIVDMSTIGMSAALSIAKRLATYPIDFLDAPVTGSTPKAISGELTIFAGGKKEIFEKVKPVLSAMGKKLNYMGAVGMGQAIKLVNNYVLAASIEALAEGTLLADCMGLSRKKVAEALTSAPVASPMMNLKMSNFVTDTFPLFFSLANMKKDVSLAVQEAKKTKKKLPLLQLTEAIYQKAAKMGLSHEDFSAIIKALE